MLKVGLQAYAVTRQQDIYFCKVEYVIAFDSKHGRTDNIGLASDFVTVSFVLGRRCFVLCYYKIKTYSR